MREFAFSFEFDAGVDPVADVFRAHPNLRSRALMCVSGTDLLRLEHLVGPEPALSELEPLLLDPERTRESISDVRCRGDRFHELLDDATNERTVYTYLASIDRCHTVPTLATRYVPDGSLFEATRRGDTQNWRILMRGDRKVGMLYDTLDEKLRDGVELRLGHLGDATGWAAGVFGSASMPPEQLAALEVAVERGYYETPREVTLDELADDIDVPRSTLSYRLRRAEARLATHFVSQTLDAE